MSLAVWILAVATAVLFVHGLLLLVEKRRGERVLLSTVRGSIDQLLETLVRTLYATFRWFVHHVFRFAWYKTAHSFLRSLIRLLERIYIYLERKLRSHQKQLKTLHDAAASGQASILSEIRAHKKATMLSDSERERRKRESLE